MSLIKVLTELDNGIICHLPAKIISKKGNTFTIRYLSLTDRKVPNSSKKIYRYEDDTYEITDESISEYLNSDTELDLGFQELSDGDFIKYDSYFQCGGGDENSDDEDYEPSSSEEEGDETSDDDEEDDASMDEFEEEGYISSE